MPLPDISVTRLHHCECDCAGCEHNGTGLFAQVAALEGDESAAERMNPAIYAILALQRQGQEAQRRCG
jgi:hypothetical protein